MRASAVAWRHGSSRHCLKSPFRRTGFRGSRAGSSVGYPIGGRARLISPIGSGNLYGVTNWGGTAFPDGGVIYELAKSG